MSPTYTVAVSGAAGRISYSLTFMIASGQMLGPDARVRLRLLDIPEAVKSAEGVALELQDSAFDLVESIDVTDDPREAFDGVNLVLLAGAKPRGPGMERSDLLAANAGIFGPVGAALNDSAADDVRVVVVGNPANTNAMIARENAPDLPAERFTALTRLDHNRALWQLAAKIGVGVGDISRLIVWGNHSPTQYPDISHARVGDQPVIDLVDPAWLESEFIPRVAKRGGEIIQVRGLSSAASAAKAVADHMHDWLHGTPEGDWTSVALPSDGSYGVPEGLVSSFPVTASDGEWHIVPGLAIDEFSRAKIDATVAELVEERETAHALTS